MNGEFSGNAMLILAATLTTFGRMANACRLDLNRFRRAHAYARTTSTWVLQATGRFPETLVIVKRGSRRTSLSRRTAPAVSCPVSAVQILTDGQPDLRTGKRLMWW